MAADPLAVLSFDYWVYGNFEKSLCVSCFCDMPAKDLLLATVCPCVYLGMLTSQTPGLEDAGCVLPCCTAPFCACCWIFHLALEKGHKKSTYPMEPDSHEPCCRAVCCSCCCCQCYMCQISEGPVQN
mmetsp:Transcript_109877/g.309906  ORF Transcript_109877/g.309906 Transcript_109877/m.309906 type:complete len:127 (+) Transcript_109877:120-500(+)